MALPVPSSERHRSPVPHLCCSDFLSGVEPNVTAYSGNQNLTSVQSRDEFYESESSFFGGYA